MRGLRARTIVPWISGGMYMEVIDYEGETFISEPIQRRDAGGDSARCSFCLLPR